MESALLNGRIISKVSRLGRTLESIQANPLWSSNHFYGLSDVCSSHTSHDGEFTFSWDQESLSSHWIDIFYRKYRVTQLVEWQTKGQIQISRFRIKCFFCHIVMSWGPSTDLNSQKEDESLSWPVPQENRKDCWDWLHDKERQLICEKRVFLSGSKKKKKKNLNLSSGWNYSSPLPLPEVLLSIVSAICYRQWSKNMKWKIPEVNNS